MQNTNIIEIKNIEKSFDGKKLFDNFSLAIKKNSVHAIIGANGSGKTSLLRILTGLYSIDAGEVICRGEHSMLLENDYLYEDKTGRENIEIFAAYFNFDADDFSHYAEMLNLKDHLHKRVSTYSRGMKRKLSLLIVIMMNREIIYLDEATSGVDPISRIEIRKIIAELKNAGKTLIITSHDLSEVEKTAEEITMIKTGKLLMNIKSDELQGDSLESLFIRKGLKNEYTA